MITLAVDMGAKKVGCVIIQAAFGTDYSLIDFEILFPVETWTTDPTNIQVYRMQETEVDKLSAYLKERIKNV